MNLLDLMIKVGLKDEASGKAEGVASKVVGTLGSAGTAAAKAIGVGVAAVGAGVAAIGVASTQAYAAYEQNVGGIQKIFGNMGKSLDEYAALTGQTVEQCSGKWQQLEQALGDAVSVRTYLAADYPCTEDALEQAVSDGAQVIFTTTVPLIFACRKLAPKYPGVRFLNCSVDMPYPGVRTYYGRIYEAKFLLGAIAGALAEDSRIGYVADGPIFGTPAAINAFAQGVRAVRPDSRVVLRWACLCDAAHPQDFSDRKDIEVFYSQDFREPEGTYRDYGLCRRLPDGVLQPLGLPEWRWDVFFTEIVRSVFAGTWDSAPGGRAINYWWGLKSGAERVEYPTRLNDGTMQLLKMAERQLCDGEIQVFPTESYSQGHALHHAASGIYTPKELMEMDWLEECVEGELPSYDELDAKTRSLLNINGLDNVKGTPQ